MTSPVRLVAIVAVALLTVAASGCSATDHDNGVISASAQPVVERLDRARLPARYRFTYSPTHIGVLDCFVGPNPDLEATVDTGAGMMSLHVRSRNELRAFVAGDTAFVNRSLLPTWAVATEWVTVGPTASARDTATLGRAIGPTLTSFLVPPRLPNDTNATATAAIEVAESVVLVSEKTDDAGTDHLRIAIDPTRMKAAITTAGTEATTPVPTTRPVVDAWVDAGGRVTRLEVGEATSGAQPPTRDPSRSSYRIDILFDQVSPLAGPDRSRATTLSDALRDRPGGTSPAECSVSAGT